MTTLSLVLLTLGIGAILGIVAVIAMPLLSKLLNAHVKTLIQISTPLLTLVFGTSITLAAAIATISIGNTTERLTEQQSDRDLQIGMQKEVDAINQRFTDLTIAISHILDGGFGIMGTMKIEMERNDDFLKEAHQSLPAGLRSEVDVFVDALDAFVAALHSIQSHSFANKLLNDRFDRSKSALKYLSDRSKELGITHHDDLQTLDVATFRHYVRRARDGLTISPVHAIARALLTSSFSQDQADSATPGAILWVAFSGYLISVEDAQTSSGDYYLLSRGLGILHDIFLSLPNGAAIMAYVREVMGDEDAEITLVSDFDPRLMIGSENAKGIDSLQASFDLALVKNKFSVPLSTIDEIAYQAQSNEAESETLDSVSMMGNLRMEETATGSVGQSDALVGGSPLHQWILQAKEGDRVAITVSSEQFDTYLYVDGPRLEPLVNNNRVDGDTNSLICVDVPATENYRIVVGAYDVASSGDSYSLRASIADAAIVCQDSNSGL